MKYSSLRSLLLAELYDRIEEYEGIIMESVGADQLLQTYLFDGTYTYDTKESIDIITAFYSEVGEIIENDDMQYPNPFLYPEGFLVLVMVDLGNEILNNTSWQKFAGQTLTKSIIKTLQQELADME